MPCHQLYLAVNRSCKVVNTLEIGHAIPVKSSALFFPVLGYFIVYFSGTFRSLRSAWLENIFREYLLQRKSFLV